MSRNGGGRSPRVLHLIPTLFDRAGRLTGGAERYVYELARHMAEVVPTRLVSFGEEPQTRTVGRLDLRIVGGGWRVRGQEQNPLHPALFREVLRADVVHCHQTHVLMSTLAAALGRAAGTRVVTSDLGGGGWDLSAYLPTDGLYRGHLHISEYSRRVFGHEGRPDASVILGGVDVEKFSPGVRPPDRSYVLFVGRLLPHKGIDDLIRAVPADLLLRVVGRVHEPAYLDRLREASAGKRVEFLHDVGDEELVELYRNALCLVLPSVYRSEAGGETRVPELLGQTLLEAMACGTPGICTDVASMPEIVRDSVTGYIVPPNDPNALAAAIRRLRDDPEMVERMGRAAREDIVARFTWAQVVERCLAAYAQ